jgi:hypothetical protein
MGDYATISTNIMNSELIAHKECPIFIIHKDYERFQKFEDILKDIDATVTQIDNNFQVEIDSTNLDDLIAKLIEIRDKRLG